MRTFAAFILLLLCFSLSAQNGHELRINLSYFYDQRRLDGFNDRRAVRINDQLNKRNRGGYSPEQINPIRRVEGIQIGLTGYIFKNPKFYFLGYYFQGKSIIPNANQMRIEIFPNGIQYEVKHSFKEEMTWGGTRI